MSKFIAIATHGVYQRTFSVKTSSWTRCVALVRDFVVESAKEKGEVKVHQFDVTVTQIDMESIVLLEENFSELDRVQTF